MRTEYQTTHKHPLWNKWQPLRTRVHPTEMKGDHPAPLLYATMPKPDRRRAVIITSYEAMITQIRLYRAARSGYIPEQVSIAELYDHVFGDISGTVSKTQMGHMVVSSLLYEPRKLINRKSIGKPTMSYLFYTNLDLQYGLEWMICTWLWKFLNETVAPGTVSGPEDMAEELDVLAGADAKTLQEQYEEPLTGWEMAEPNWDQLTFGFTERLPPMGWKPQIQERGPKPRDLSKL